MNTIFKKTLLASLVVPFALSVQSASATEITEWGFSVDNMFSDATFSTGGGTTSLTNDDRTLTWGDESASSSVSIDNASAPGGLFTNGDYAMGGTFTHSNQVIDATYAALTGFNLTSSLTLNPVTPAGVGTTQFVSPLTFASSFIETKNTTGSCFTGSVSTCDDIFTLNNLDALGVMPTGDGGFEFASPAFTIEDYSYTVFLELVGLGPLGDTCAVAGAPADCAGLVTQENQDNVFETRFRIASAPVSVPEPGTLALLGLGLTGLGLSRRRKAAKA